MSPFLVISSKITLAFSSGRFAFDAIVCASSLLRVKSVASVASSGVKSLFSSGISAEVLLGGNPSGRLSRCSASL